MYDDDYNSFDPQGYEHGDQPDAGDSDPLPPGTQPIKCSEPPPRYAAPEHRARLFGYSHQDCQTVGRWLEFFLNEAPLVRDSLDFWRSCHILRWLANPEETQAELAARLGVSQQWVSKLVVKISEKLAVISRF